MNALALDHAQNSPPYMYVANVTGVVKFYNRAKGAKTWRYLGSAPRSERRGRGLQRRRARFNGNYRAVFPPPKAISLPPAQ